MWTILASICGNIVGIGLVACLAALRERVGSRRPQPAAGPPAPRARPFAAKLRFALHPRTG